MGWFIKSLGIVSTIGVGAVVLGSYLDYPDYSASYMRRVESISCNYSVMGNFYHGKGDNFCDIRLVGDSKTYRFSDNLSVADMINEGDFVDVVSAHVEGENIWRGLDISKVSSN